MYLNKYQEIKKIQYLKNQTHKKTIKSTIKIGPPAQKASLQATANIPAELDYLGEMVETISSYLKISDTVTLLIKYGGQIFTQWIFPFMRFRYKQFNYCHRKITRIPRHCRPCCFLPQSMFCHGLASASGIFQLNFFLFLSFSCL